jgi:hypothetical protein
MNRWFASTYSKNGSNVAKMEIDSDDVSDELLLFTLLRMLSFQFKYTSNECFVTVLGSEEKGSQLPNLMSSLAFEEVVSQVSEVGVSSEDSTPDNDVSSEVILLDFSKLFTHVTTCKRMVFIVCFLGWNCICIGGKFSINFS